MSYEPSAGVSGGIHAPRSAMLPCAPPCSGTTPYGPTLMSVSVRPVTDGFARVPHPDGFACIQRRSNLPSRIIARRSKTSSTFGLIVVAMAASSGAVRMEADLAAGDRPAAEDRAADDV